MAKLKGLGKGLEALLAVAAAPRPDTLSLVQEIALTQIRPGKYQPRVVFDEKHLHELAESIKYTGVIQPVVVRQIAHAEFELIAGERRWRASQLAEISTIPALVREFSDEEALAISLIENIQRQDLNVIEEAQGYRRLIDEFGLTHEYLAQITGKSRSSISNTLRLLNLAAPVSELVMAQELDMGHARALLPLDAAQQIAMAKEIVSHKLTTAEVENKVSRLLQQQDDASMLSKPGSKNPDIYRLEESIADKIGMMVGIKHNRSGNGKITISYASVDELEGFLERLR